MNEAYQQNALLTYSDAAFLLNISTDTMSKQINEYMRVTNTILPMCGIKYGIGRTITHKKIIIRLN